MECAIDQVIKSMVVLDKYPEALAQLAQLHKIPQDMMVRLACRKNRAEHLAYKRDSDGTTVLWRDYAAEQEDEWHREVDGIYDTHNTAYRELSDNYDILVDNNRNLTERNDALRGRNEYLQAQVRRLEQECYTTHYAKDGLEETMSRMESEIKRARDSEEATQAFVEKARAYLTKARTKAGRAEFAATSAECPRAELHAQSAHALISEALRVLDRA